MIAESGNEVKALSQYNSFNNRGWLGDVDNKRQIELLILFLPRALVRVVWESVKKL